MWPYSGVLSPVPAIEKNQSFFLSFFLHFHLLLQYMIRASILKWQSRLFYRVSFSRMSQGGRGPLEHSSRGNAGIFWKCP
jgi:hypothetical protein